MPSYIERLWHALIHINVPIPSIEGFGHWYLIPLGLYTILLFGIGLIIGYIIKIPRRD